MKEALDWFNSIDPAIKSHAVFYAQRWYPIELSVTRFDDNGKRHVEHPNCLKRYGDNGALTEELLISELGYGDYTFRFNDSRLPMHAATVLASELKTARNWSEHPPRLDYKRLDMDDPGNASFILWARSRGLIPNETGQEQEDMQNQQSGVVDRLTTTVENLTGKVIQQAESQRPGPAPAAPPPQNGVGSQETAIGSTMGAMARVVEAALSRPQPAGPDLKEIAGIVKSLIPANDTAAADLAKEVVRNAKETNDRIYEIQRSQLDEARKDAAAARAQPAAGNAPPPLTRVQMLRDAVEEKQLLKQLTGHASSVEEESKPGTADKLLDALPHIAPAIGQFFTGIFNFGLNWLHTSQVNAYNEACARTGKTPQLPVNGANPSAASSPQQTPAKAGEPMAPQPPQPPPPSEQQTAFQQGFNQIMQKVVQIAPHLIRHLQKGKSGAEFAEFVIDNAAEEKADYLRVRGIAESLRSLGVTVPGDTDIQQFMAGCQIVFQQYPPLWNKVGTLPPSEIERFLADFYNYDQILDDANSQEEATV